MTLQWIGRNTLLAPLAVQLGASCGNGTPYAFFFSPASRREGLVIGRLLVHITHRGALNVERANEVLRDRLAVSSFPDAPLPTKILVSGGSEGGFATPRAKPSSPPGLPAHDEAVQCATNPSVPPPVRE